MNRLRYENNYYEEALDYSAQFSKTKEDGYYKVDLTGKSDQIETQQNNTIIALLASLHYRLTLLETKILSIEQTLAGTNQNQDWHQTLENINKDLKHLSAGKTLTHKTQTYSFITYRDPKSLK